MCNSIRLSFLFFLCTINICIAQSINIKVRDHEKLPLVGATIQLHSANDSLSEYRITNNIGIAFFENIEIGNYTLKISYLGFEPIERNVNIKQGKQNFEYQLKESAMALDAVTITARRPLIRQEDDKMIIDPEPIASTSSNTLEVLESTPGLFVDQDGGIYLSSTSPAVVYINGREQKMSNQDVTNLLRTLPPESIQRIEVLRTPSTKYDAASSGGIINIVLKKGVKIGRFGSINAGMNQGVYGNRFIGLSLNNSNDNSTSYVNINYSYNDRLEELNSTRLFTSDTALNQSSQSRQKSNQFFLGYGINYDLNEKLNLSYDGRLNASFRESTSRNSNFMENVDNIRFIESNNLINNDLDFANIQQDLGLIYKIDTLGSEWDTKFSYSYINNSSLQDYSTEFIMPFTTYLSGKGDNKQHRHFYIFQSDLTYQLFSKIKVETGIKSTYQTYHSNADFFINQNGNYIADNLRTNLFKYEEAINSAYFQASRPLGFDLLLKGGVRIEHTYMKGQQIIPNDTSFIVDRADWFPYVYLSRPLFTIASVELKSYLIYRKTINRPGYQNLNPDIKFIDQFLYETGNPSLKPQFTENFEANISFNDMPIIAVGQNLTTDVFSSVVYAHETEENVAVRTYDNLGKNKETYLRLIAGIPPGKKYFFAVGSQYNLNEYNGIYQNQELNYKRGSWRLFTFHSLNLFKETKLTMSGFMMINGNYNFFELENFGMLNFGLTQTFLNKKLSISLNARDVLRSMVTEFQLNQGGILTYGDRYTDNRRFGINIRYNFGIKDKEDKKNMFQYDIEE